MLGLSLFKKLAKVEKSQEKALRKLRPKLRRREGGKTKGLPRGAWASIHMLYVAKTGCQWYMLSLPSGQSSSSSCNPGLHIVARTRFDQEMSALYGLGADEVIPEEFETSVEIFTRVLVKYLVPRDEIEKYIVEIRADGYGMFRQPEDGLPPFSALESHLHEMEISILNVEVGAPLVGRTLAEVQLRKHHGVTLLVAYRGALQISNPHGDFQICAGDRLTAIGSPICLPEVAALARQQPDEH